MRIQELLGSLSMVCSILVGFGLAGLVTIAVEPTPSVLLQVANGLWLIASILLLAVLVISEFIRRQEVSDKYLVMTETEQQEIQRRCGELIVVFFIALFLTAGGIIVLGFHLSIIHGLAGAAAFVVSLGIMYRLCQT